MPSLSPGRMAVLLAAFGAGLRRLGTGLMRLRRRPFRSRCSRGLHAHAGGVVCAVHGSADAGAAVGGMLGNLGDAIGRKRALGISIPFYSLSRAWLVQKTQEQMLVLRFLVGLGWASGPTRWPWS